MVIVKCLLCSASCQELSVRLPPRGLYWQCSSCDYISLAPELRLSGHDEKQFYLKHETDLRDPAYARYLLPLVTEVQRRVLCQSRGLDFGCGQDAGVSRHLAEHGFRLEEYDPFFAPHRSLLAQKYDFIVACEVAEHFFSPRQEFEQMAKCLSPGAWLFLQTSLVDDVADFDSWYYRRDPTHVGFYSLKSLKKMAEALGFDHCERADTRVISLRREQN